MKKYRKETSRLTVKFIDSDTEELLFEIEDRNWSNVGELLQDYHVNEVTKKTLEKKGVNLPENLMVIVVGNYSLV